MRIAIHPTRLDPDGGVERYVWALTRRLLDAGHEVHYHCARVVKPAEHPRLRLYAERRRFAPGACRRVIAIPSGASPVERLTGCAEPVVLCQWP